MPVEGTTAEAAANAAAEVKTSEKVVET